MKRNTGHEAVDPFLIDPGDGTAAAAYLNPRLDEQDLVIASPGLAWALAGRVADPQMSVAFDGRATPHLPAGMPRDRFLYSPRLSGARYVVVDNYWLNWGLPHVAGLSQMIAELESWPRVFSAGMIEVYCNPIRPDC